MKKFLLSAFVIFSFIAYSLQQKNNGKMPAITPPNVNNTMPSSISRQTSSSYKDGTYTGDVADALYGNLQVQAIIQNGKITDVKFLQYPNDGSTSRYINTQAGPILAQEAIQKQNENVDIVSGATASSQAFIQSLGSALAKAKG